MNDKSESEDVFLLDVANVGKVVSAKIALSGITIIAGENATGKSTVSRALCALCSMSFNMTQLVRFERVRSICQVVQEMASKLDVGLEIWNRPEPYSLGAWSPLLGEEFWGSTTRFAEWIEENFGYDEEGNNSRLGWIDRPIEKGRGFLQWYAALKDAALKILSIPLANYENHVCIKLLNTAYDSSAQWRNVVSKDDDFHIILNRGAVSWAVESALKWSPTCRLDAGEIASSILYLEPVHVLDMMVDRDLQGRYVAGRHDARVMLQAGPPKDVTLEMQRDLDDARMVLDGIAKVIGGRLRQRDEKIVFEEDQGARREVSIANMASGMKTMAAIVRAVENGTLKRGGLLVIDEPESNLHPQWQISFAKFLVLLHREFGVRVLLTTHSPYFFKAIRVNADFAGVGEDCRYYQMLRDEATGGFVSHDRTADATPVYESMMKPYAQLKFGPSYDQMDNLH